MSSTDTTPPSLTDTEVAELGQWVYENYQSPFLVAGRTIKNIEMHALLVHTRKLREQRIEQSGCCCEDGPLADGRCRYGGMCKLFKDAEQLLFRHEHQS